MNKEKLKSLKSLAFDYLKLHPDRDTLPDFLEAIEDELVNDVKSLIQEYGDLTSLSEVLGQAG